MKKLLLGIGMVLMAAGASAQNQDHLKLTADKNIMDAAVGEEITYTISLVHVTDSVYAGFSCDLWVGDGVQVIKWKKDPKDRTAKYFQPVEGGDFSYPEYFGANEGYRNEPARYGGDGGYFYRLIGKTDAPTENYFPYDEEFLDLFNFKVKKTEEFVGDVCPIYLRLVEFASEVKEFDSDGNIVLDLITVWSEEEGKYVDQVVVTTHHFPDTKSIALKIGDTKFGTLCINDDLDFSESGISANVCTGVEDGFVQVAEVTKPAAGTPLILKGEAGSYFLNANYGEKDAPVSNLLVGTPDEAIPVAGNTTYAMASKVKDGANVVGFYRVQEGVVIPRYKAYLNSTADVEGFIFEETTGINTVERVENANQDIYTITGAKVNNAAQKGVYIMNGKKVVVK